MGDISWVFDMSDSLKTTVPIIDGEDKERNSEVRDCAMIFDRVITREPLRSTTRNLFMDKHWARAVEQGYKTLNQEVKSRSGLELDGLALMQRCFSEKNPLLSINHLKTQSERNEQVGYMMIMGGAMLGIRNPRAHEPDLVDTPKRALELLITAHHLIGIVQQSSVST